MKITGLNESTFENLQLGAGAFFINVNLLQVKSAKALLTLLEGMVEDEDQCLGATVGGGTFVATPNAREIEVDGKRYKRIGSTVFDDWEFKLTGTMKEIKAKTMKRVLACADAEETQAEGGGGSVTKLTVRTTPEKEDYIQRLCWVGDTSKGFVAIVFDRALNLNGVNMTFADKGEGSLPFEFSAYKEYGSVTDNDTAPVTIYFFE